jgi:hypothetical protein
VFIFVRHYLPQSLASHALPKPHCWEALSLRNADFIGALGPAPLARRRPF